MEYPNASTLLLLIEKEHTKQKELDEKIEHERTEQFRLKLQLRQKRKPKKADTVSEQYLQYDSDA